MLGQDLPYTDPASGYTVQTDTQAYRDASAALLKAETYLADLGTLAGSYEAFFSQAQNSGYPIADDLFTIHADILMAQDRATQDKATLQTFVDRYRVEVLGSGVAGLGDLGVLPVLVIAAAVGVVALAAAIGALLYKRYNVEAARIRLQSDLAAYQRWLAEQVTSGGLDPATAQALAGDATKLSADVASGGGSLFTGLFSGAGTVVLVVIGLVAYSALRR